MSMLFSTANLIASVVIVADVVIRMESTLFAETSNDFSSVFTRKQFLLFLRYDPRVLITSCMIVVNLNLGLFQFLLYRIVHLLREPNGTVSRSTRNHF